MILNTGSRTDIPAYYSEWLMNRLKAKEVLVRNPYYPEMVTRYRLTPEVIDAIIFCTKNPKPMLSRLSELQPFQTFWFMTITPYGKDIEPFVPDKHEGIASMIRLSEKIGAHRVSWRYDPVFITPRYTEEYHVRAFQTIARLLKGYTTQCVVSFLDLYEKTKRNFPAGREVSLEEQKRLIAAFAKSAEENGMQIHLCCEDRGLVRRNVDADGCMSKEVLERALGFPLSPPKRKSARETCSCLLGADIGQYNSCGHGCIYCYANYDRKSVLNNMAQHDPDSPLLIGHIEKRDIIKDAEQFSWREWQVSLFDQFFGR